MVFFGIYFIGDYMPFLLTFLAGCSTLIGYLIIYIKNDNNKVLITSLAFASGVMFFMSLFDLIPEGFKLINTTYYLIFSIIISLLFLTLGIMTSSFINKSFKPNNSYLYKVGIISMIAIILHNIPEGIATFLTTNHNLKLGIALALSLALHNIPEGISISIPIYYSTRSKKKAFLYTLISGMSEFLGAILAAIFLTGFSSNLFMGCLYLFIAGIMIYISLIELLPTSIKYKNYYLTVISFIFGILFIYVSILLIH